MKKLRRSGAAKIAAFFLCLLCGCGALMHVFALYEAYEQNLMHVSLEATEQKLCSYAAERTQNDLIRYFNLTLARTQAENNSDYYDTEIALCRSKYDRAHSNAAFRITDKNGKTLLSNYKPANTVYTFTRSFTASETVAAAANVYTVTVLVQTTDTYSPKDLFYYTEKAARFIDGYKNALIPMAAALSLFSLACAVFLLYAAGYTKKSEKPVCGGVHRAPSDLTALLFLIAAGVFFAAAVGSGFRHEILLVFFALPYFSVLTLCFAETLAVRIRTKTLFRNTLLCRLFRLAKRAVLTISTNLDLAWKLGLYYLLSGIAAVASVLLFGESETILMLLYLVFKAAQFAFFLLLLVNVRTIRDGTKKLLSGETGGEIRHPLLFGAFRSHAADLSAVSHSAEVAVQERLKSERMKTELITNVSHDLKTPLTSIVSYVDLLKKADVDNPDAQSYIAVIDRQAQRLKKLTEDVVEASKAASGAIAVNEETVDLGMLIGQICGEYAERLQERALEPVLTLPETPLLIRSDGRLLWRVFDNLMNNVCKYALSGTRVYLTLTDEGETARAVLRNVSAAPLNIAPEELTARFVRGDASRSTEGSGLGLSISMNLTQNLGGAFRIGIDGDLFKATLTFPKQKS